MATINHQYEAPKLPGGWTADEKRFYNGVIDVFDDIYRRWGRLGEKDLSVKLRTLISDKADGETVTSLTTRIEQTESEIALKASSETVNALGERVSTAETSITQNATAISSKASQSDVNALGERVTTAESEIRQTPDRISAAVSGMRIGGRNYLLGTAVPYMAQSDGTARKWLYPWPCASAETAKSLFGRTVTLSFDYDKAIASGSFQILSNVTYQGIVTFDAGAVTGGHFERTMTFSAAESWGSDDKYAIYIDGTWNGTVTFRNVKLEIGDKATDWSTAPEEVQIGSSILMDAEHTEISTPYLDIDVPGTEGDMHIDEHGISAGTATFNTINCPGIVKRVAGRNITITTPSGLQAEFDRINGGMLDGSEIITLACDQYGAVTLRGIYGNNTGLTIKGGYAINGKILITDCHAQWLYFDGVTVNCTNDTGVTITGSDVRMDNCTFNSAAGRTAIRVATNSRVMLYKDAIYNAQYGVWGDWMSWLFLRDLKGTATVCYWTRGCIAIGSGTRPSGDWWSEDSVVTPSSLSSLTIDTGSAAPVEPAVTTTSYTANVTGTYYPSGHWINDNTIRQGHEGTGSNGRKDYGCMWFNASALSGKTIKSATLTIKRISGKGRSGSVTLKLWTTTLTGKSGKPTDSLVSLGDIGTIANGETATFNVPVSAISVIAAGGGFVLYTEETSNASGKDYSRNYAHFEGTDGSAPVLTVTYQ